MIKQSNNIKKIDYRLIICIYIAINITCNKNIFIITNVTGISKSIAINVCLGGVIIFRAIIYIFIKSILIKV